MTHHPTTPSRRAAVAVAAGALMLAACGSSDSPESDDIEPTRSAATTEVETDSETGEATSAGSAADAGGDAASDAGTSSEPARGADDTAGGDGGGDDSEPVSASANEFCVDMMSSVAMATSFQDDDVQARFALGIDELENLVDRAPDPIAADVQVLLDTVRQLDSLLAPLGYDLDAIPEEEQQALVEPAVGATDRVREYCDAGSSPNDIGPASLASATVTIGDEVFMFAIVDDGGSCTDSFAGGVAFRAILTRIDEDGEPVPMEGEPTFTQGFDIFLPLTGDEEGVIYGNFGEVWSAGDDQQDASSIDSFTIDGLTASGTATFVNNETGDVEAGSFEVSCAG